MKIKRIEYIVGNGELRKICKRIRELIIIEIAIIVIEQVSRRIKRKIEKKKSEYRERI